MMIIMTIYYIYYIYTLLGKICHLGILISSKQKHQRIIHKKGGVVSLFQASLRAAVQLVTDVNWPSCDSHLSLRVDSNCS